MKLIEVTDKIRNDFSGILQCEHCEHEQVLNTGYDDNYYHNNVIPAMKCGSCGLDRSGAKAEGA